MCQFTDLCPAATGKLLPISTVQIYKMHRFWVFDQKKYWNHAFWDKIYESNQNFQHIFHCGKVFFMFISKKAEKIAFFTFFYQDL